MSNSFRKMLPAAIAAVALSFAGLASAGVIGDTVTMGRYLNGQTIGPGTGCCGPVDVVVAAGTGDLTNLSSGNNLYVDMDDLLIRLLLGPFGGSGGGFSDHLIRIEGIDFFGDAVRYLTGITIMSFGNISGFSLANITFADHSVIFNVGSWNWSGGQEIDVALTFSDSNSVPEPGSLTLLGLGIVGLGIVRRRKQNLGPRPAIAS